MLLYIKMCYKEARHEETIRATAQFEKMGKDMAFVTKGFVK